MRLLSATLLLALAGGCTSPTAQDRVRVLADIAGYHNGDPQITVVQEGRRVDVSVTTYGGGCHTQGEAEVVVRDLAADITPYDYTALPGTGCTRQLVSFVHRVSVQFHGSGTARLRIRGIDGGSRTQANMVGDTLVIEHLVGLP